MKLMLLLCLLMGVHHTFGLTEPNNECCQTKSVGSVEYALAHTQNTSTYGCLSDCVYTRLGEDPGSQKYCFKAGDLPVNCGDQDAGLMGVDPPPEACRVPSTINLLACTDCSRACIGTGNCKCANVFRANANCLAYGSGCFLAVHTLWKNKNLRTYPALILAGGSAWFFADACHTRACMCPAWKEFFELNPNAVKPDDDCEA